LFLLFLSPYNIVSIAYNIPACLILRCTRRGRHRVGTVCSIAGSATARLAGVVPPAWIRWLLPGGHSVPDRRVRDVPRAGAIYRPVSAGSLPGRHSVLDRWERDCPPAGGDPPARIYGRYQAGTVCLIPGSATVRRLVVNRLPGSAGRYQAGTV
jgi:hypothetical protein